MFSEGAPSDEPDRILGVFSTIFWSLTAIVLVKYVGIVLWADDDGEGEACNA